MNKKIIMSLSVIAAVSAAVIGGTGAFFSDVETSTGNTFTAGAIDLKVDSQQRYNNAVCVNGVWALGENEEEQDSQYPVLGQACGGAWSIKDLVPTVDKFFNFGDVKPGDNGSNSVSLHVINNDAWVCAEVSNLANNDNGLTEPEDDVDATGGVGQGELQQAMVMTIWNDANGDNVQDGGESVLYSGAPQEGAWALHDSTTGNGPLVGLATAWLGVKWDLPLATGNQVQTDSLTGDVSFKVVQSRNNAGFKCGDVETVNVNANDLAESFGEIISSPSKWFFYNDTNDTVMTLNQFVGGVNDIVAGPDAVGAAQMTLHDGGARYNIATYKYSDVKLSDINSLKYRMYDDSASAETPFLHFNVDLNNSNTWQGRLVQVPTGVVVDTWTTVDAMSGMWTKTSGNWPVGTTETGSTPGSTPKTWANILAEYPNAETRSTDSFLGVRVGHPGPNAETGFVDWIEFDGEMTDFEN